MPDDNPGLLDRQSYVDIVAYMFWLNGYPEGMTEAAGRRRWIEARANRLAAAQRSLMERRHDAASALLLLRRARR